MWEWGEARADANELMHYGVKGQKKGVRRYQNEDGTLTAEGKERYAGMYNYGADKTKGLIRRQAEKMHGTTRAFAEWREGRHEKNLSKVEKKYDKKIAKQKQALKDMDSNYKKQSGDVKDILKGVYNDTRKATKDKLSKLEAKKARKTEKYRSKKEAQSAANSDLQAYRDHSNTAKLLMRSAAYEHARARGTGRLGSIVEAATPIGGLLRMSRDKKKYGKRIVYSGIEESGYDASAMDRE